MYFKTTDFTDSSDFADVLFTNADDAESTDLSIVIVIVNSHRPFVVGRKVASRYLPLSRSAYIYYLLYIKKLIIYIIYIRAQVYNNVDFVANSDTL